MWQHKNINVMIDTINIITVKEKYRIYSHKKDMNFRSDKGNLSSIYQSLIK